jgi:hypothetical protein
MDLAFQKSDMSSYNNWRIRINHKVNVDINKYLRYINWNKNSIYTYTKTNEKSSPKYLIQGVGICTVRKLNRYDNISLDKSTIILAKMFAVIEQYKH